MKNLGPYIVMVGLSLIGAGLIMAIGWMIYSAYMMNQIMGLSGGAIVVGFIVAMFGMLVEEW